MPLIATALTTICLNTSGQYNQACNKGLEAGTKQSGTYQLFDDSEKKTMAFGEDTFGKTTMDAGGAGVYLYRAYKSKSVTFKMPQIGLADTITNQVTPNSYKLNFNWHF